MTRVKGGTIHRARRKKIMKRAKGYFGSKHRLYRTAKEQVMHSLKYAYRDRRQKKRDFRKLWITRINAACRQNDISYSKFINGLSKAGVTINRKMLSEIAIDNPKAFTDLVELSKSALNGKLEPVKEVKEAKKTTKEVKETKEVKKEENVDLSKKTVAELREIAKEKGISGVSTMKKAELLDALK
ncbi:MAG: 50S ribosomal protein L20 [Lactobacillales bacterium]|nr:50S ribosomal protein L20 [Lactobacillales bacterium]